MTRFVLCLLVLTACSDDEPGTSPDGGGDGSEPAWSGGPEGHLYVNAGPLYDIDTRDGRILRRLHFDHGATGLAADADHAYFNKFDTEGQGRAWRLGLDATEPEKLSDTSSLHYGIYANQLIGVKNASTVIRIDIASGATTETALPAPLQCENGSLAGSTLYLVCMRIDAAGFAIGMLAHDLATSTSAPFVVVKTDAQVISMASNVTVTPSGITYVLYEGSATLGTQTAYRITGSTVGTGVPIDGMADDLEEQAAVGDVIFMTQGISARVVPFDTQTMTAGTPIAVTSVRHLRTGGGMVWVSQRPDGIVRIDPATSMISTLVFPALEASNVDSMAYGE